MQAKGFRLTVFLTSIPILLGVTGLWVLYGWRIGPTEPPSAILGGFPIAALAALVGTLPILLCSLACGGLLCGCVLKVWSLPVRLSNVVPALTLSLLSGMALLGMVSGFLAFLNVGFSTLLLGTVASLVGLYLYRWVAGRAQPRLTLAGLFDISGKPLPTSPSKRAALEGWLVGPFLLAVGLAAFAPAVESDGLRYHLAAPEAWLRAGQFVHIPYSANSNLPAFQGLLAAITGSADVGRVYQLVHAFHFCFLVVVCMELSRRVFRSYAAGGRACPGGEGAAGALGGLFAVSIPAAAIVAAWPFADVTALTYLLAGVWVLAPGTVKSRPSRMMVASLLLGAAVATKISILPLACIAGLWGLAQVFRAPRRRVSLNIAMLIIPGALVLAPWLIKNTMYHGNPVYPLGYGVFGGEEWSEANELFYKSKMAEKGFGRSLTDLVQSPFDVTVNWPVFEGQNPGPALMALLPFTLFGCLYRIHRRVLALPTVLMALLVIGWVVWFNTYQSVRFLLPQIYATFLLAVPFLIYTAGAICTTHLRVMRVLLAVVALAGALWAPAYHVMVDHVYQGSLGLVGEDVYIARRFNSYPAIQWLNDKTEKNEPVFYIGEHRAAYADYQPVTSDWFDMPLILVEIQRTQDNDALLSDWREQGIRYVLLNQAELRLYEQQFFKPRFTEEEWQRFDTLRQRLMEDVVFDSQTGVYIQGIEGVSPALP